MVLVRVFGQLMQIVNGPGTTDQGTFALRRAPGWAGAASADELVASMSPAQIDALTSMAGWAENNLAGETGTTTLNGQRIPRAAMMMRERWRGEDFGGRSASAAREAAKERRIPINEIQSAR